MRMIKFGEGDSERKGAYVQAKIIRKTDDRMYLRIWNNGSAPAYNVNFFIPKDNRVCVLRSRMNYKVLDPGKAFDEFAVADEKLAGSISIITYWEDAYGNLYSKEQQGNIRKLLIG